jgi:hypothetical protein
VAGGADVVHDPCSKEDQPCHCRVSGG